MTKRETIIQAFIAALAGTSGVGSRIFRSRAEPLSRAEAPALEVTWPDGDDPSLVGYASIDWTLVINVDVLTRGDEPDALADPIIESMHAKIMSDAPLAALVMGIYPAGTVTPQIEEADKTQAMITCPYRIQYRTSLASLTA